jgi:hypothetical protein
MCSTNDVHFPSGNFRLFFLVHSKKTHISPLNILVFHFVCFLLPSFLFAPYKNPTLSLLYIPRTALFILLQCKPISYENNKLPSWNFYYFPFSFFFFFFFTWILKKICFIKMKFSSYLFVNLIIINMPLCLYTGL